jgi:hypothetical protein
MFFCCQNIYTLGTDALYRKSLVGMLFFLTRYLVDNAGLFSKSILPVISATHVFGRGHEAENVDGKSILLEAICSWLFSA